MRSSSKKDDFKYHISGSVESDIELQLVALLKILLTRSVVIHAQ